MRSRVRLLPAFALLLALLLAAVPTAAQIDGTTYVSPTYGYTVVWNGADWQADPQASLVAAGPDALDRLLLNSELGSLYVEGARRYGGDARACVPGEAQLLGNETGVESFAPLSGPDGAPIAGEEPGRAFAAFVVTIRLESGGTVDLADYIECHALVPGESVIIATIVTTPGNLPRVLELARPVIDSIAPPGGGILPDDQVFANLREEARRRPSLAGPLDGSLELMKDTVSSLPAGVDVAEFYASARFVNPYPASEQPWDFGFGFRSAGGDEQFRLVVDSDGVWYFKDGLGPAISSGRLHGLDLAAGGANTLEVATNGETGYFAVNGTFVAALDLSSRTGPGDVFAGAGFFAEDVVVGESTGVEGFEVWSLEPPVEGAAAPGLDAETFGRWTEAATATASVAGPAAGELALAPGAAAVVASGATVQDFYARVRFATPASRDTPWDVGFAFRDQPGGEHYRLIVDATGRWIFKVGLEDPLASGAVSSIDLAPGGVNTVELVAVGDAAGFAVNGAFVAALDVSRIVAPGGVWFGAGFDAANVGVDGTIAYRDFQVWSLDGVGLPEATPGATPVGTPAAVASPASEPIAPAEPPPALEPPRIEPAATPVSGAVAADEAATVAVLLGEAGGSGVGGLAVLVAAGATTDVELTLRGAQGGELLVIHEGTCADLDPAPAFLLNDPDASGRSQTTLRVGLEELRAKAYAIAVRQSAADFGRVVACGEIPPA